MSIQSNFLSIRRAVFGCFFRMSAVVMLIAVLPVLSLALEESSQIDGFNLEGFDEEGEKSWEVNGTNADIQGTLIKLTNIIAHSYGEEHYQVTAKTGSLEQQHGKIHLKEDVVIRRDDGARLTTDELDWDRKADIITTEEKVVIVDDNIIVTGRGMESRPGLKQAIIEEDVKVKVESDSGTENENIDPNTVVITSDGPMSLDQMARTAVFEKNVKIVQVNKTVTSDWAEAYFSPQTNKITEVVCIGNVVMWDGENTSYAQKAIYNVETQKVKLFGRPKLILETKGEDVIPAPPGD